jgi:hypothetical protein
MKRRFKGDRFALGIAAFSLLLLFTVFIQYNPPAQIPFILDCLSIENSQENDPLAREQNRERPFGPISSHETALVAVTLAEKLAHLAPPTLPHSKPGSILRC